MLQVFFDLNETEKVPDEQVYNYFRLWIHHCVRIKDSVENQQPQQSQQQLDVRNTGHGGQINAGSAQVPTVAVQSMAQNQNYSMTARAMVNGQEATNIPIGRLYPDGSSGRFVNNTQSGPGVLYAPNMVQKFPTPVKNISPVKIGNQKIGTVSKKRPSEEESDQEAKIIKHEVPEATPTTPPTRIIQNEPPTRNIEPRDSQPEVSNRTTGSQQAPPYSLSQDNMKALSMSASNQIRRGPVQSEATNLPHSFPHFQNPSQANLSRALSQISKTNERFQPLNSAHRRGIGFESRMYLQDKITLLQSTNDILTSGNYFQNFHERNFSVVNGQFLRKEI